MKAFTINTYGKNQAVAKTEIAVPTINDDEVLVEVHAASINQLDVKVKSGEFKLLMPYKLPLVLGYDVSGVVTNAGARVDHFKVGDEVFARAAKPGAFAEYIAVNQRDIALKPANISMEEAAALPLVALTVWQAFVEKAKLQKGQKVFIQAGSGGVGTIAIQLAKHIGATVATTTSVANAHLVKSLGADVVIDYKTQDFETILKDYDLVLNSQDANTLEKSLRIVKPGGKVISISGPPDVTFAKEIGLSWIMRTLISLLSRKIMKQAKRLNVAYSFLFMQANGKQLSEVGELIESGSISPIIDKVFSFDQTNEAMLYVQSGRARGKVVLKVK
ncbi:NADP-dependent oxidoreductase [Chryseolinea lacunae]|uniref:NADP-dependent oxidoreductase n=1 Tax=Chryseolinea lacunae TaxID=2801331 RepID=A0ABS1KN04_9BACT|nr:NADP-dependent oxidoreductase [Chryseolinea lacunae]MBL0740723.1 NADP-dependent oxidoreductase [Chryseolinea lacunae]